MKHTPSFLTRRLLVFSPSTKLIASIKFDFPAIYENCLKHESYQIQLYSHSALSKNYHSNIIEVINLCFRLPDAWNKFKLA